MTRKFKILVLLVAVGCLFIGNLSIYAAENPFVELPQSKIEVIPEIENSVTPLSNPSLTACNLGIGIASNGLQITFVTSASETATEIGVKDVVLQEKVWYGWKNIPANNYCTYNSDIYTGSVVYTAATKGTTYRVKCTHYAKFGSNELTLSTTSSELVYN